MAQVKREYAGVTMVGRALCAMGLACALAGILLEGLWVEMPATVPGAADYAFAARASYRTAEVLGVVAVVLCAVSVAIPSLDSRIVVGVLKEATKGDDHGKESCWFARHGGAVLGLLGLVCGVVGIFYIEGISMAFLGIILGGLGYYFGLTSQDRMGQILGISTAVLSAVAIGANGLEGIPYGPLQ